MRHYFITYTRFHDGVRSDIVTTEKDLDSYEGLKHFIDYMKKKITAFELQSWKLLND